MFHQVDGAIVFIAAFAAALFIHIGLQALKARDIGWSSEIMLEVLELAVSTGFMTAAAILGYWLSKSTHSLTASCVIGLAALLPMVWVTRQMFANLERKKASLTGAA